MTHNQYNPLNPTPDFPDNPGIDKKRMLASITYPALFVLVLWCVKIVELIFDVQFTHLGIFPLSWQGLPGILFSPFIHSDFGHLISNSFPLLVLGSMLFYFYKEVAWTIFFLAILITGFWVWVMAREAWHVGASGVIYSLAAFLFTSGIIRKHPRLMALSLIVAFLYGGMVWGVFPIREQVSWESHLLGLISGVVLAVFFRPYGPQRKLYSWELEELQEQERQRQEALDQVPDKPDMASLEEEVLRSPYNINENGHPEDATLARVMKYRYIYKPESGTSDDQKEENS